MTRQQRYWWTCFGAMIAEVLIAHDAVLLACIVAAAQNDGSKRRGY